MFEQCPRKYAFAYIEKPLIEKVETIEAFMGDKVHKALHKLYKDLLYSKTPTQKEIIDFYNQAWQKAWHKNIKVVKDGYTEDNYRQTGETCLKNYYQRFKPFAAGQTIGLEQRVDVDLTSDIKVIGYIDRLSRTKEGVYEIHDYKTSSTLPAQRDKDEDRQLALYQIAIESKYSDVKEVKLIWHFLVFDVDIISQRTSEDLESLKRRTLETIGQIEKTVERGEFEVRESSLCDWCDYQSLCPARKHLFATQNLDVNEYLGEDGVSLVKKYAELLSDYKEVERVFEEEKRKLEEAIFEYAAKKQLTHIFGGEYLVKVKSWVDKKFPNKSDARRGQLDALVKELGLWEECSDLNPFMLAHKLESDGLSDQAKEKLAKFAVSEKKKRISISHNDLIIN